MTFQRCPACEGPASHPPTCHGKQPNDVGYQNECQMHNLPNVPIKKKNGKISLSTPVFLSGKSHAMARVAMVAQSLEPFLALDLGE